MSYSIGEFAQLCGITPTTLRAWQRRYGLLKPMRTDGGHRLYSEDDIQQALRILDWVKKGVPVSQVKPLLARPETHRTNNWLTLQESMLQRLKEGKIESLRQLIYDSGREYPRPELVSEVLRPLRSQVSANIPAMMTLREVLDGIILSYISVLVALLAPAYLLAGSLQARPATTFMAMGITLTLPVLCELGAHYSGDFAGAINTAIALFAATGFAVVGMSLLQTVQADAAIKRLLRLCQRDIRRSVKGVFKPDEIHWTNIMIDRTALLLPRLQRSVQSSERTLNQMLHSLRIGLSVMHLRRFQAQTSRKKTHEIRGILHLLTRDTDPNVLRQRIQSLIDLYSQEPHEQSRQLVNNLIDLHCALREQNPGPNHG